LSKNAKKLLKIANAKAPYRGKRNFLHAIF